MNDQERQIIADIFRRLEGASSQPRDPEAERLIAEKIRAQPYAPYAMAQALYVQEEALKTLNAQLEEMRAENDRLAQAGQGGGSFLSSIFGGGSRPQPGPARAGYGGGPGQAQGGGYGGGQPGAGGPWGGQSGGPGGPAGGPWQQGAAPQAQAPGGGGFLRGALTTAAGVAGGMMVGSALMNAFSGSSHSTLGSLTGADQAALGGGSGGMFGGGDAGVQNASFDDGGSVFQDAGYDGGGGDFDVGGDDGWS